MRIIIIKAFGQSGYITGTEHEVDEDLIERIKLNNEIKIIETNMPVEPKPKRKSK